MENDTTNWYMNNKNSHIIKTKIIKTKIYKDPNLDRFNCILEINDVASLNDIEDYQKKVIILKQKK